MFSIYLSRFGAQTMARFLMCMLVSSLKVARWARCFMRYSRVLRDRSIIIINIMNMADSENVTEYSLFFLNP